MATYLAFLRGINVGGNNLISMADLRSALAKEFDNVRTYIQSGNVLFESGTKDTGKLAAQVEAAIEKRFKLDVRVAVFSGDEWSQIIADAPKWWGKDNTWKHNLLIMLEPVDLDETLESYGTIKPDIENVAAGERVLYQSLSLKDFGRTTGGKLAANPVYKQMTIRNYNTATKLLALL